MNISIEQLTDSILRAGLMTEEELSHACYELQKKEGPADAQRLLAGLQSEGRLTSYQASRLNEGRGSELVLGNYVILSLLGEGGMGSVFKAVHRRMDRVVAVKVLKKDSQNEQFRARFRREIKAAARLNHANIVVAYDADECELGDFLVMEYIEGTDLEQVVRKSGPLEVSEAINAIRQAALGLAYAHRQGIVHRDIKPANLMRDLAAVVKVADLGLAQLKHGDAARTNMTQSGIVAGTVDFMPPEQATDTSRVDHRADMYSLGCTLFYLLTGGPMFVGDNLMARLLAHRDQPPPRLCDVRDGIEPALDAIFQRMVAKSPDDRFQSMDELVAAIDALTNVPPDPESAAWDPTKLSFLVVEQSKFQANMIKKIIEEAGAGDVKICAGGHEALQQLALLHADVVLTSMQLPDMSGIVLAQQIRDELRWSRVNVLLMTADKTTPQIETAVSRLGGVGIIRKPFKAPVLRTAVESLTKCGHTDMSASFAPLRVLIVDDSSIAQKNVKRVLSEFGFANFTLADDGVAAVEKLRHGSFDLIVTDFNMPRMDGLQLVTYIRRESMRPDVPIIMVTTEHNPQKLMDVYQLGVSAICNKSFDRELVRNIVIQLFL